VKTLQELSVYQEEIKKSLFLARAIRSDSIEEAMAFLETSKKTDASHNCWAYKICDSYRFSDDGEPGGTAGRPIFMTIEQQGFDHVTVIVTRYFGGIKLGTGGLARAYGGTAGKCLQQAREYIVRNRVNFTMTVPFENTGIAYSFLDKQTELIRLNEEFTDQGICFSLQVVEQNFEIFKTAAMNCSSGIFQINVMEKVWE